MFNKANVTAQLYQDHSERALRERMAARVAVEAFNLSEQALAREASIAGVDFGLSYSQGLSLNLSGFNDKHAQLAERVLDGFASYEPSSSRLEQVKDRIRRNIENQALQFPVQQLGPRYNAFMQVPGATSQARLEALAAVTMEDVKAARDGLFDGVTIRMLAVGNYDAADVESLAQTLQERVTLDAGIRYQRNDVIEPRAGKVVSFKHDVTLEDVALLDAYIVPDDSLQARAKASLFAELAQSRFFNELRTEKQLGYAVGVSAVGAGDFAGVGYLIQSSVASLDELDGHFSSFRDGFVTHLEEMSEETFDEAKQGVLVSLREQPQNLNQEAGRVRSDWARENYRFDTREQTIDAIERLTREDMQAFYQQLLDEEARMRVMVQLRGTKFSDSDFIEVDDAVIVDDIESFQQEWRGED